MRSTHKNNQYYFGLKLHIGKDINSNVIQTATVTSANIADIADIDELPKLLRADDKAIFADAAYTSDIYKRGARQLGLHWWVNDKRKPKQNLSNSQRKRNRKLSSVRAKAEHCFLVIKRQFATRKPNTDD